MVRFVMAVGLALALSFAARGASAQAAGGAASPSWQYDMAGSDAGITLRIVHKLAAEGRAGRGIAVATQGGVVTLSGQAISEQARQRAIAAAQGTAGVKSITDAIRVPPRRR
jgi:osmotically-inducible protein OsmY